MLSQLNKLSIVTDGRYATDAELKFLADYVRTFRQRVQTYQQIQQLEGRMVQAVYERLRQIEPTLFLSDGKDITLKWKQDTIRVLRYSAIAMLLNDPLTLRERLLFWFQTIMKAFGAQKSCQLTYVVMQEVVKQHLGSEQAALFCPILEINRQILGNV